MKLIKGRRKDFKTEEAYLKDIFNKNRAVIAEAYGKNAEQKFINSVRSYKQLQGGTITGALKKVERSRAFTPYADIATESVKKSIIKYGKWDQFRSMTRGERGRFTAYDPSLLIWDRDSNSYIYNNLVRISFENSPEDVILQLV